MKTDESYIIFECPFDLTMNIMATMVVSSLKSAHKDKKIIVVTGFPEVWLHNPDVYRIYKFDHLSYFFDDFIKDKDTLILKHNPILTEDYLNEEKHLAEIWCDLYNIKLTASKPLLYFTWREKEAVQKLTKSPKPLFFIESEAFPYGFGHTLQLKNIQNWQDSIPSHILGSIIKEMNNRGYQTIDISETTNPKIDDVENLTLNLRLKLCAIQYSSVCLFINSFAQQVSSSFEIPTIVAWTNASPKVWGYNSHINIEPKTDRQTSEYLKSHKKEFSLTPQSGLCPFDLSLIYDTKDIVKKLDSINKTKK